MLQFFNLKQMFMYYKPEIVYRKGEIEGERVTILRESDEYILIKSEDGRDDFSVLRKSDGNVLDWCGSKQVGSFLSKLKTSSVRQFNKACKSEFDAAA